MIAYYSPACKSVKWFRKVLTECISMGVVNNWVLYNRYNNGNNGRKMPLGAFVKRFAMSLLTKKDQNIRRQVSPIPRKTDRKIT